MAQGEATLDEFRYRFAPAGYDEAAMIPCYGMAEATLFISGKPDGTGVRVTRVDRQALEQGRAEVVTAGAEGGEAPEDDVADLVSCGQVAAGHHVCVVDPEARVALADGLVGEVWVAGPSVAAGYFHRPDATAEAFGIPGPTPPTGRATCARATWGSCSTASSTSPAAASTSSSSVAATSTRRTSSPRSAAAAPTSGRWRPRGPAGTIRRTTSGKVQRNGSRQAYRRGELRTLTLSEPVAPSPTRWAGSGTPTCRG